MADRTLFSRRKCQPIAAMSPSRSKSANFHRILKAKEFARKMVQTLRRMGYQVVISSPTLPPLG